MDIDLEEPMDTYEPSRKPHKPKNVRQDKKQQKSAGLKKNNPMNPQQVYGTVLSRFHKKAPLKTLREIIRLLGPFLEEYPEHIQAQKIMAFCLICDAQYSEASLVLKSLLAQNRNDSEALNAMAYLALSEGRLDDAVNHLLDAVYEDSSHAGLKKNLEKLRTIKDPKVFFKMTPPADFLIFTFPAESPLARVFRSGLEMLASKAFRPVLVIGVLVVLGFFFYRTYPFWVNISDEYRFKRGLGRGRVTHVTIQDIDRIVAERQNYSIKMSEDDIKMKFEMVKTYIEEKKPNRAMITVNELLNSNASDFIKERVGILKDFIADPGPDEIDYSPDVSEVIKTPFLYQGVTVRWSGTVANLEHKDRTETAFDLLINFVEQAVVEGIANCHYQGFVKILSGEKIAVYGKIAGISIDNKVIIKGKDIQKLGR